MVQGYSSSVFELHNELTPLFVPKAELHQFSSRTFAPLTRPFFPIHRSALLSLKVSPGMCSLGSRSARLRLALMTLMSFQASLLFIGEAAPKSKFVRQSEEKYDERKHHYNSKSQNPIGRSPHAPRGSPKSNQKRHYRFSSPTDAGTHPARATEHCLQGVS